MYKQEWRIVQKDPRTWKWAQLKYYVWWKGLKIYLKSWILGKVENNGLMSFGTFAWLINFHNIMLFPFCIVLLAYYLLMYNLLGERCRKRT